MDLYVFFPKINYPNITLQEKLFITIKFHTNICVVLMLWCRGTNLGIHDLNFGYTHAFETTFDDLEGLQEYLDSSVVAKFAEGFLPTMSQQFVMDYELY